jgi:CheY-like chemotaxis protein
MAVARILIVEDERLVAFAMRRWIEELGYAVVAMVATGAEAVAQALAQRPDVVLMDIRLRDGIDGIEAARQIQAQAPIPIIYLSAYNQELTRAYLRGPEPAGYLQKPFNPSELERLLAQVLKARLPSADEPSAS